MTVDQIKVIRNTYKGYPMIVTLGGTSTWICDNFPNKCYLVWDDANDLVSALESNRENSGMNSNDYPFVCGVFPYSDIESIRIMMDTVNALDFNSANASKLPDGRSDYNKEVISRIAHNTKPNHQPYFK